MARGGAEAGKHRPRAVRLARVWLAACVAAACASAVEGSPVAAPRARNATTEQQQPRHKVIGYYTNWAQYRPGLGFYPENIDATKLTHVCYAFARVTLDYLVEPYEWNDVVSWDPEQGMYNRFHAHVRAQNPAIKTLISLGGWNAGSTIFSPMIRRNYTRKTFIDSAINFARYHTFDGLDIDWEFPTAQDKDNYALLMSELRSAIDAEARQSGRNALLLAAAVPAGETAIDAGYDVPTLATAVDWIGVMAYDLHGSWEHVTGAHTALYSATEGDPLTVTHAMSAWRARGAARDKLVVGMALYGRGWTLVYADSHGIGARARGASAAGKYTREMGFLAWYEIRALLNNSQAKETFDYETETMIGVSGDQWIGYDNPTTLRIKTTFVEDQGYAGAMIWSLDLDDFTQGYPLVSVIAGLLADADQQ